MKTLISLLMVSLALTNCDRPASSQAEISALRREIENLKAAQQAKAEPAAAPLTPPILALTALPLEADVTPTALPIPEPTPARQPRLAPEGVFYLTQRVSIPIEGGIMGLPPGTVVTRIAQDANGITIQTANGLRTVVQAHKITNDLDQAEEIAANFAKEQREGALVRAQVAENVAAKSLELAKEQREKEQAEIQQEIRRKQQQVEKQNMVRRPVTSLQRIGGGM